MKGLLSLLVFFLLGSASTQSAFMYADSQGVFFLQWVGSTSLRGQAAIAMLEGIEDGCTVSTFLFSLEGVREGARLAFRATLESFPLVQTTWTGEMKGGKLHLVLSLDGDPLKLVLSPSSQAGFERALKELQGRARACAPKPKP